MKDQRADTDSSIAGALKTCTQAMAPLTEKARLRVLNGLRAFMQAEGPLQAAPLDIPDPGGRRRGGAQ